VWAAHMLLHKYVCLCFPRITIAVSVAVVVEIGHTYTQCQKIDLARHPFHAGPPLADLEICA